MATPAGHKEPCNNNTLTCPLVRIGHIENKPEFADLSNEDKLIHTPPLLEAAS